MYKSEDKLLDSHIRQHKWNSVKILTAILCKEDPDRDIRVDFYKYFSSGNHKFICATNGITLNKIRQRVFNFELIDNKGKKNGTATLH